MTLETTPASTSTEGNYRIKFVTTIAGASATVAEFDDGDDITYSLTPDGWNPSQDQAVINDERMTLEQILERPGKKTKSLTVKYVDGAAGATSGTPAAAGGCTGANLISDATADAPWSCCSISMMRAIRSCSRARA